MRLHKINSLKGKITVPGDKSISHRAVMFGSIAKGQTKISGFLNGADCLATIRCFQQMGIRIEHENDQVTVYGKGLYGLSKPSGILDTGNSGTTTRLLAGILAGQPFTSILSGDVSLNSRPMGRIITPLSNMGASITSLNGNDCAPLKISPGSLSGITYHSPVASAQVKSACLLAGLYAKGETIFTEPSLSRNHTELMLTQFGAKVSSSVNPDTKEASAHLFPCEELYARELIVPGDISSAAYFIAAGLLIPNSEILIQNVGINPTRAGILKVCQMMGADITYLNRNKTGEPTADLLVKASHLCGTTIKGELIPTLIDEIPIIAVMAACAEGTTIIKDAEELKVKETDRIFTITENLKRMGADVTPTSDGMIIHGGCDLKGTSVNSYLDHRIAMAFSIAALLADGETEIQDASCVDISYPSFYETLHSLID